MEVTVKFVVLNMGSISFKNRNSIIYSVLMLVCIVGFWLFQNFYTPASYSEAPSDTHGITSVPAFALPRSTTGSMIDHRHYCLSYSETHEQAEWVAYVLKKEHLTYDDRKRPYFIEDPKVSTKSADWKNYRGSGYDRGHLCPAGDRRFSEQAYNETFYTSNISPQDRDFNAGIWNRLEQQVRRWAKKKGTLYVITGGILEKDLDEIGAEAVSVPEYYYKIVASGNASKMTAIAFLMEGKERSKPLHTFVVPIDELEKRTGIDFFYQLSDQMQASLESGTDIGNWPM